MLVKDLLSILPHNQVCKLVYLLDEEIVEVKGKPCYISNNHPYLLDLKIATAYTNGRSNCINICI